MLKGIDTMATRTDTALWELAKLADGYGVANKIIEMDSKKVLAELEKDPQGIMWIKALNNFLNAYGHRISAAHLDVIFPTWIEDPSPVMETLKTYISKVRQGWNIQEDRTAMIKEGQAEAAAFGAKLSEADRKEFERQLEIGKKIYQFQEDHGFYIDGSSTARLHDVAMVCGRRLVSYGLLEKADDVFFLNFSDLSEVMSALAENLKPAIYHYRRMTLPLVKERKEGWQQAADAQEAPLTMGSIPDKVEDPILIKVFGMIDDVLKAGKVEELEVMDKFEGYPGAPGVAEGIARVVTNFEGFAKIQRGEILVCPYTATAWTPLFPKIKAVVTDTGGMLTHAAITAREYRLPAVVGTWRATRSIKDGDFIRVDGTAGTVEILKRA